MLRGRGNPGRTRPFNLDYAWSSSTRARSTAGGRLAVHGVCKPATNGELYCQQ